MTTMRRARFAVAAIIFSIAFATYIRTLAPTVALVDSGELTVAAWSLGNAHPPGFPVYLMLAHLFTLLPSGSVAWRVNLASAASAAMACSLMSLAAGEWLLTPLATRLATTIAAVRSDGKTRRRGSSGPPQATIAVKDEALPAMEISAQADWMSVALLSAFAGLLLTFSKTLWGYATLAEVYAVNTVLILAVLWLVLSWWRRMSEGRDGAERWIYAAAVMFGLALGVHHLTVALCLPGIGLFVLLTAGWKFLRSRRVVICAIASIVAASVVYTYLPVAASHRPPMNWGNPDTVGRVVDHITAKQYRAYIDNSASVPNEFFRYVLRDFGPSWAPVALLLAAAGLLFTFRRDRALFAMLLAIIAADLAWSVVYPIVNDKDAYELPAIVALVLAATAGARFLTTLAPRHASAIAASLLVVPLLGCATAWRYRDRSHYDVAANYAHDALSAVGPNGLLLTGDWELYSPIIYFRDVEKERPDITVIETGMLIRSWYLDSLELRYPALMKSIRPELSRLRPLLERWEKSGGAEWERDEATRAELFARVNELLIAMVTRRLQSGPVYASMDFALSKEEAIQPAVRKLAADLDVVPRGVVLEYMPGHAARQLAPLTLHPPVVADGPLAYEADDVVVTEVLPVYRSAYLVRGRYLVATHHIDEGIAAYRQAVALDPENSMIQRELSAALALSRN